MSNILGGGSYFRGDANFMPVLLAQNLIGLFVGESGSVGTSLAGDYFYIFLFFLFTLCVKSVIVYIDKQREET